MQQLNAAKDLLAIIRACAVASEYDDGIRLAYIAKRIDEFTAADLGDYAQAEQLKHQATLLGALMVAHHQAAQAQPATRTAPIVLGAVGS